jgi:integrase/recombinase XerD
MIKTLFQSGARVDEFVHIRVEDLLLGSDPPQIHIAHAKRQSDRYVPILPALADELRTHLQGRARGFLFESNRHHRYSARMVQSIVKHYAQQAGIAKRVHPHLLRHSVATILLDSGLVPIDQVQKFLGHLNLATTQIYAETSLRALGNNYVRALGGTRQLP